MSDFVELVGKTFKSVSLIDDYMISMVLADGSGTYDLYHSQDCCEEVWIDDVCGDLNDLVNLPVLRAEEVDKTSEFGPLPVELDDNECYSWTFYKLSTIKGSVTIRFFGASNGNYSESADLVFRKF